MGDLESAGSKIFSIPSSFPSLCPEMTPGGVFASHVKLSWGGKGVILGAFLWFFSPIWTPYLRSWQIEGMGARCAGIGIKGRPVATWDPEPEPESES
jgi:hypothetical protein